MEEERIKSLICQYLDQDMTEEENRELKQLILQYPALPRLLEHLKDDETLSKDLQRWDAFKPEKNLEEARERIRRIEAPRLQKKRRTRWMMAAVLVGLAGTGAWLIQMVGTDNLAVSPLREHHDAAPGGNRAILTLGDGKKIRLDSAATGNIAGQTGSRISKKDSGTLVYTAVKPATTGVSAPEPIQYNLLTTPRGGQFAVTLPDQTKVWLNNCSSLHYPTAFTGHERMVTLTGEAYFEVSRDNSKPFRLRVNDITVNVLGTHFVVTAYPDEKKTSTTLLEGKIQLNEGGRTQLLTPGEQLIIHSDKSRELLHDVDMDEAMAWKEGYFHFSHANLPTILRQIGRWYNLEVDMQIPTPDHVYDGEIDRHLPLSNLLNYLTNNDVHFHIEEKKLIVTR
jgi:ferric-dicitrate binding protein FerR (iron transport regulator)